MSKAMLGLAALFLAAASFASPVGNPASDEFAVKVASSAPDQVTGGDARLHILVPRTVPLHQVEVWVNGVDRRSSFTVVPGTRTLTGVIDGLVPGHRLCVLGNNSGRNAGDAAILSSIVHNFHQRAPEVTFEVPTIKTDYVRRSFAGLPVRPVSVLPWTLSVRIFGVSTMLSILRSDAVLITDAIIFDYRLLNPVFNS